MKKFADVLGSGICWAEVGLYDLSELTLCSLLCQCWIWREYRSICFSLQCQKEAVKKLLDQQTQTAFPKWIFLLWKDISTSSTKCCSCCMSSQNITDNLCVAFPIFSLTFNHFKKRFLFWNSRADVFLHLCRFYLDGSYTSIHWRGPKTKLWHKWRHGHQHM